MAWLSFSQIFIFLCKLSVTTAFKVAAVAHQSAVDGCQGFSSIHSNYHLSQLHYTVKMIEISEEPSQSERPRILLEIQGISLRK